MTSPIATYYNILYKSKGADAFPFDVARYREILSRIPDGDGTGWVLDYGCGAGALVDMLYAKGYRPIGMDISAEALAIARSRYPWVFLERSSIKSIATYQLITCLGVLEHIPFFIQTVKEMFTAIALGGHGLFMVANSQSPYRWFGGTGQSHEEPLSRFVWQVIFENAGFRVESVGRDPGPSFGWRKGIWKNMKIAAHRLFERVAPLDWTYQFVFVVRK